MKIAILSDIHGNLEAFDSVLKYIDTQKDINAFLFLGDLIDYGPHSNEVIEMIKNIKLGLYAKKMGGGCVSPETGDFNFACDLAYMIRDGKIAECVKSASLIGNCKDILQLSKNYIRFTQFLKRKILYINVRDI